MEGILKPRPSVFALVASFLSNFILGWSISLAATLGTTTGADFTTGTWSNTASTSIGNWYHLQNPGSSFAIGDSSQGGRASIGSQAFNLSPGSYTNNNLGFARTFFALAGGSLSVGQTLSFDINFIFSNGTKGFSLEKAGGGANFELFSVYLDWADPLKFALGGVPGTNVSQVLGSAFQLATSVQAIQQVGSIDLTLKNNGNNIFTQSVLTADPLGQIHFFAGNIDPTQDSNTLSQGIFFNNISVIPEPSCLSLFGLGAVALLATRRKACRRP